MQIYQALLGIFSCQQIAFVSSFNAISENSDHEQCEQCYGVTASSQALGQASTGQRAFPGLTSRRIMQHAPQALVMGKKHRTNAGLRMWWEMLLRAGRAVTESLRFARCLLASVLPLLAFDGPRTRMNRCSHSDAGAAQEANSPGTPTGGVWAGLKRLSLMFPCCGSGT